MMLESGVRCQPRDPFPAPDGTAGARLAPVSPLCRLHGVSSRSKGGRGKLRAVVTGSKAAALPGHRHLPRGWASGDLCLLGLLRLSAFSQAWATPGPRARFGVSPVRTSPLPVGLSTSPRATSSSRRRREGRLSAPSNGSHTWQRSEPTNGKVAGAEPAAGVGVRGGAW